MIAHRYPALIAALAAAGCVAGLDQRLGLGGGSRPAAPAPSAAPAPQLGADNDARVKAYLEHAAKFRGALGLLLSIREDQAPHSDPARTLELYREAAGIDELARACAERDYESIEVRDTYPAYEPPTACANAREAKALLDRFLDGAARRFVEDKVGTYRRSLATLSEGEWVVEDTLDTLLAFAEVVERWKQEVAPLYTERALEMPAELFAPLEALPAELPAALKASQAAVEVPRGHNDAIVKRAATDLLSAAKYHGARVKVTAVRVTSPEWSVFYRQSGVPWYRIKMAEGLIRAKGEAFCRMYPIEVRQDYRGGGRFVKAGAAVAVRGPRVAACP